VEIFKYNKTRPQSALIRYIARNKNLNEKTSTSGVTNNIPQALTQNVRLTKILLKK